MREKQPRSTQRTQSHGIFYTCWSALSALSAGALRPLDDLDADIRDHIERETADNIARGMPPDEARAAALRAFGSVTLAKENTRAVWIPIWIDQVLQDARHAVRMFRRSPIFCLVVVATLAIGIGLTTAVFSVVNAVLVRPLSYPVADRLVWIATYDSYREGGGEFVASPDFLAWREQATSLDRLAGFFLAGERIDVGEEVVQARIAAVTDGFWDIAGARPELGRVPGPDEEGVVLSHAFFERWFRGDPSVVGRPVSVEGRANVVTGVLPAGFHVQLPPAPTFSGIGAGDIDFYRAAIVQRPSTLVGFVQIFQVIAWLKPGVSIARASEELAAIRTRTSQAFGGRVVGLPRLRLVPYSDKLVGGARRPLLVLLAAVVLVLAIACANVANLLLARGSARQREIAIRTAVGAGRGRVLRQFLVENLILTAIGGAAGLLAARGMLVIVLRLIPQAIPRLAETTIDGRVLAFATAMAVTAALVCGLAPAFTLRKTSVHDVLKDGARTASASPGSLRVRRALVAAELAVSVVLLVGAGLLLRSFWRITAYPPGFTPEKVLTMRMQFSGPRYRDAANRRAYVDELLQRARSAPGVEAAGVNSNADGRMLLYMEGAPDGLPRDLRPNALVSVSSGSYADAIGMRVVKGRWMRDDESTPVWVVNEALVRRFFPGRDPVGMRFRLPWIDDKSFGIVVGVVADLRYASLDAASEPEVFTDYKHSRSFGMNVVIRTAGDPAAAAPALRALLSGIDRTQPLFDVRPLDVVLADSIAPRRFNLFLLATFAGTALVLALVGIYGVIAYSVEQRTHEIGVRMALGAERRAVVRMVVRQGMAIASAGIAIGVVAALALTPAMTSLLYEVTPTDPPTFAAVVAALAATALVACGLPAIKASLVDPIVALRCE